MMDVEFLYPIFISGTMRMLQNNNKMLILKLVPPLTNAKLNTKTGISAVLRKACVCLSACQKYVFPVKENVRLLLT